MWRKFGNDFILLALIDHEFSHEWRGNDSGESVSTRLQLRWKTDPACQRKRVCDVRSCPDGYTIANLHSHG